MIDFQTMKKEMLEEARKVGREEVRKESINKFIVSSRNIFGASDDKILVALEQQYGDSFTRDELVRMIKQTK